MLDYRFLVRRSYVYFIWAIVAERLLYFISRRQLLRIITHILHNIFSYNYYPFLSLSLSLYFIRMYKRNQMYKTTHIKKYEYSNRREKNERKKIKRKQKRRIRETNIHNSNTYICTHMDDIILHIIVIHIRRLHISRISSVKRISVNYKGRKHGDGDTISTPYIYFNIFFIRLTLSLSSAYCLNSLIVVVHIETLIWIHILYTFLRVAPQMFYCLLLLLFLFSIEVFLWGVDIWSRFSVLLFWKTWTCVFFLCAPALYMFSFEFWAFDLSLYHSYIYFMISQSLVVMCVLRLCDIVKLKKDVMWEYLRWMRIRYGDASFKLNYKF